MSVPAISLADVIPPGMQIEVRSDAPIDVSHWDRGRIYPAHVARDVVARDGDVAIPRGSAAELIVRQIGPGQYSLDLESVTVNGRRYAMDTTGQQFNMPRNSYDNGNGVVGAIIGAIAGANGDQVEARGGAIRVPAGSMLTFRLEEPLRVVDWGDPGYNNDRGYHYHRDRDWYR
jgi:hypothetical protein